jgi:hypothetical protein
MEENQV